MISRGIDGIWEFEANLVEMHKFSKWNKGIKYLLMVIDVFSKYGWIKPLKDKKTETVEKAFDEIFKSGGENQRCYGQIKEANLLANILKTF